MHKHKRKTIQRLLQYSATSLGVLCTHEAAGQMVYTDIDPDIVLEFGGVDSYALDLDNNGTDDFVLQMISTMIEFTTSSGWSSYFIYALEITPLDDAEILISDAGDAVVLGAGSWVDDIVPAFSTFSPDAAIALDLNVYVPKFLALRFTIDGNTHYGWMRLLLDASGNVILKDHAYEATPETAIYTQIPDGPLGVTNIALEDVSDTHTVADLQVSFDVPADESNIAAYRIFTGPFTFDMYSAANATADQYTEVLPTGTSQTVTINGDQLDRLGQVIEEFDLLRVSVFSVGFTDPYENVLVQAPNSIVLGHAVQPPTYVEVNIEPAIYPYQGIETTFGTPADLDGVINFFSLVVPADMLATLDTSTLCGNMYHVVLNYWEIPGGVFQTLEDYDINVIAEDITGADISFGQSYAVCVLSHTVVDDYTGCAYERMTCSDVFIPVDETVLTQNIQPDPLQVFIAADGIHVQVQAEQGELFLYDISGQLISRMSVHQNTSILPLPESSGWYVVAMHTHAGVESVPLLFVR